MSHYTYRLYSYITPNYLSLITKYFHLVDTARFRQLSHLPAGELGREPINVQGIPESCGCVLSRPMSPQPVTAEAGVSFGDYKSSDTNTHEQTRTDMNRHEQKRNWCGQAVETLWTERLIERWRVYGMCHT